MNRKDTNDAIRDSLCMPEKRTDRHNVYALKAKQERAAVAVIYPRAHARLDNVSYMCDHRNPLPPAA